MYEPNHIRQALSEHRERTAPDAVRVRLLARHLRAKAKMRRLAQRMEALRSKHDSLDLA